MKKPYPSETAERIIVRLPDGMRDRLGVLAKANKRSVNAEVVAALEAWVERDANALQIGLAPGERFMVLGKAVAEALMADETVRSLLKGSLVMIGPADQPTTQDD